MSTLGTRRNEHVEFVGLESLIDKNSKQLSLFEQWAREKDWQSFHTSHYDWWVFPIDQASRFGYVYTVFEREIETLKENKIFITNLKRATELLLLSWGWDLYKERLLPSTDKYQCWQNWPIRLYKCAQCLHLFGLEKELQSVRKFGRYLLDQKQDFKFRGKDLSDIFL